MEVEKNSERDLWPDYFTSDKMANEEWELGVDEAGRGPVLGPMVYGVCFWPLKLKERLSKVGFNDSKKLDEDQRERLFDLIKKIDRRAMGYYVDVLDPEFLSNKMLMKTKYSLNKVSFDSAIGLIEKILHSGINIVHCYLDTVGGTAAYQTLLLNHFQSTHPLVKFTVAEKADSTYPVVSAASICAKVTRDKALENWQFREKNSERFTREFGGGYPGNTDTVKWLKENFDSVFGFPDVVRFSWKTCSTIINEKMKVDYGEDDEETQEAKTGSKSLLAFYSKEKHGKYITSLGLTHTVDL